MERKEVVSRLEHLKEQRSLENLKKVTHTWIHTYREKYGDDRFIKDYNKMYKKWCSEVWGEGR